MYTPFVPDKPQQAQATKQDDEESGNAKITGTIQKEIVDTIKENGLPSDVDAFISQVDSFLGNSSSIFSLGGNKPREYTMAELMRVQSMANRVAFNNTAYQKAAAHLTQENAWSEVATDSNGRMYVVTEEGIKLINPGEFDQESMNALTNKQVMDLRANNQELAFNNDMLTSANGAVSMTSITNHLKNVISDFATNSSSRYSVKMRDQIEQGLEQLLTLGPDGFYKVLHESKGTTGSNEGMMQALNYLVGGLNSNMRNLLRAKAAAEGKNPNNMMAVFEIVGQALVQHTGTKQAVDFDSTATKAVFGDSSTGSEKMENLTMAQKVSRGLGVPTTISTIRPDGQVSLQFMTQDYGAFVDKNDKMVEQTNVKELFTQAEQLRPGIRNSVYFGEFKVGENDLNKVVWDNQSTFKRMDMLVKRRDDGSFEPLFDLYAKLQEFKDFASNPNIPIGDINNELNKLTGGIARWNPETQMVEFKESLYSTHRDFDRSLGIEVRPVGVFEGYMTRDTSTITDKHSKWMTRLRDDLGRSDVKDIRDIYEALANRGTLSYNKSDRSAMRTIDTAVRKLYRAPVFVVLDPLLGDVQTGADYDPSKNYYNRQAFIESNMRRESMNTNFASQI